MVRNTAKRKKNRKKGSQEINPCYLNWIHCQWREKAWMNDLKDPPVVSHTWQLNSKLKVKTPFYLVGFIFILEEMQGGGKQQSLSKQK